MSLAVKKQRYVSKRRFRSWKLFVFNWLEVSLPLSFKRFIGLKNYGLIFSFSTKKKSKSKCLYTSLDFFQSTDRSKEKAASFFEQMSL